MGFIDSYKHLEKLCGEVLNDDRRVSAYIDEMLRTPRGSYYVKTWDEDLKNLKHYRWVRNQISHEPGCTEQNMCEPSDTLWLDEFYSRIMSQEDPLALYYKATRPSPKIKSTPSPMQTPASVALTTPTYIIPQPRTRKKSLRRSIGPIAYIFIAFLTLLAVGILALIGIILLIHFI